jgi:regulator of ribonuclease activity A
VLFRQLLGEPGDGGVIVVDGGGSTAIALMGDMLAARARDNGWAGVIINGAIRDSAEIAGIDIGVKALGVNPAKSAKKGEGETDVAVEFGGVRFRPGEWVYCDEDGVKAADSAEAPLRELRELHVDIPVLLLVSTSVSELIEGARRSSQVCVIAKPCVDQSLTKRVLRFRGSGLTTHSNAGRLQDGSDIWHAE